MSARIQRARPVHGLFGRLITPHLVAWLDPMPVRARIFAVEDGGRVRDKCRCGVPEHFTAIDSCRVLDGAGHIDYLLQTSDGALRGIGARIQQCRPEWADRWPFNSFTTRAWSVSGNGVEADHIRRAVNNPAEGLLFPGYLVHAYVNGAGSKVDSVAMIRTADLLRFMDAPPIGVARPRAQPVQGGNGMVPVAWDTLARSGVHVWRWPE